jgi:hypothetical protein
MKKANLEKFYESIKGVILHLGSLDELNKNEQINGSGITYELMPQRSEKRYITGTITPTQSEIKEAMKSTKNLLGIINSLGFELEGEEILDKEETNEIANIIENFTKQLFENPAAISNDIRLKAKEIGADGLIHVQLHTKDSIYMGVPVKKKYKS